MVLQNGGRSGCSRFSATGSGRLLFNRMIVGALDMVNLATYMFVIVSLMAGLLLMAAVIGGLFHTRYYNSGSLGGASTTALTAWVVMVLAFGLACRVL
ncbi:unnamed protein product [Calypogeia fissa]